jgi:hypothetical protein
MAAEILGATILMTCVDRDPLDDINQEFRYLIRKGKRRKIVQGGPHELLLTLRDDPVGTHIFIWLRRLIWQRTTEYGRNVPRYKVHVTSDDAGLARVALNEADIPTMGPTYTGFAGGSDKLRVGDRVIGYPVAKSPEEAEAMVRRAVGQQEIGPAEALSEND